MADAALDARSGAAGEPLARDLAGRRSRTDSESTSAALRGRPTTLTQMQPPTRHRRHRPDRPDYTRSPLAARTPTRLGAALMVAIPATAVVAAASPEFAAGAVTALAVAAGAMVR